MLVTWMFHDLEKMNVPDWLQKFENFLIQVKEDSIIVSPGEKLRPFKKYSCLVFDDGYCDFYYEVFPLLKKHNIKATLAICTGFICDKVDLDKNTRMAKIRTSPFITIPARQISPSPELCSWEELREMTESGLVTPASHSISHCHLRKTKNLTQELVESKQTIIDKLGVTPEVLVIPYGDTDNRILKACKKYYSIVMRVGWGFNLSWTNIDGYCYRLDADKYWVHGKTMPAMHKLRFWQQFFTKSIKSLLRRN